MFSSSRPNLYSADVSAADRFYAELLGFSSHADVDAAVARVRSAGAPVLVEPYDHVAGHRRAYVPDPDGNWLAFVQGH